MRSYLDFSVGDRYDEARVNTSLRALFATGLFADVNIIRQGSVVVISVVENPIISKVAFEGNSEVDTKTLKAEVRLKSRSVYTRAKAVADAQRILDVYRRQGMFAATVDPKIIEIGDSRVNLVFEITEGVATKVQSINFIGNSAFSDSQLRDIITTTQAGWLDFFTNGGIYDPERLASRSRACCGSTISRTVMPMRVSCQQMLSWTGTVPVSSSRSRSRKVHAIRSAMCASRTRCRNCSLKRCKAAS